MWRTTNIRRFKWRRWLIYAWGHCCRSRHLPISISIVPRRRRCRRRSIRSRCCIKCWNISKTTAVSWLILTHIWLSIALVLFEIKIEICNLKKQTHSFLLWFCRKKCVEFSTNRRQFFRWMLRIDFDMCFGFDRMDSIVHRHFDRYPLKMMWGIAVNPVKNLSYYPRESIPNSRAPLFLFRKQQKEKPQINLLIEANKSTTILRMKCALLTNASCRWNMFGL